MKLNRFLLVLIGLTLIFLLTSCGKVTQSSADKKMEQATENAMKESFSAVGMPAIRNWNEKKLMKWIYELRDEANLGTFTYIQDMHGKLHYIGRSIGYGIPASVQYSNPQKLVTAGDRGYAWGLGMPQPEPNGLFMPEGLSATYIIMIDPTTKKPRPIYFEPTIVVSPFPLPTATYPEGLSYGDVLSGKDVHTSQEATPEAGAEK